MKAISFFMSGERVVLMEGCDDERAGRMAAIPETANPEKPLGKTAGFCGPRGRRNDAGFAEHASPAAGCSRPFSIKPGVSPPKKPFAAGRALAMLSAAGANSIATGVIQSSIVRSDSEDLIHATSTHVSLLPAVVSGVFRRGKT
jgi:hypothetical protein